MSEITMKLRDEQVLRICRDLMRGGAMLSAIVVARAAYGFGLKEAKDWVEGRCGAEYPRALAAADRMAWSTDMEAAPQDKPVQIWCKKFGFITAQRKPKWDGWFSVPGGYGVRPEAWRPLPPPPAPEVV